MKDHPEFATDLVQALLRDQHPDLAELELRKVNGGWDNQQWRLGAELAVRMPRSERAPALLETERAWLPGLAERLPLPTPVPVRAGFASRIFPHTWTIARWVPGEPADREPITDPESAVELAGFLAALHFPAPGDAPKNPTRGVPLAVYQEQVGQSLAALLADHPRLSEVREIWAAALAAPVWQGPPLWVHGDLHPANVVTRTGRLAGVLDFGELCAGDPATDLSAAWLLLPEGTADRFFESYAAADPATITRARGWAVLRAIGLIAIGQNGRKGLPGGKPTWEPAGYATLDRLLP